MNDVMLETSYLQIVQEVAKKFDANTDAYLKKLYPKVEAVLKTPSGRNKYKKCVSEFIQKRSASLYDTLPCSRILFGEPDAQELFTAMGIQKAEVTEVILQTYYGNETNFSPKAAQDEFTVLMICIIRFFMVNHNVAIFIGL